MKKKIKQILPITISLMISATILTAGWIADDAKMNGITISAEGSGVEVLLKTPDTEFGQTATVGITAELKPCVYKNGKFYDQYNNEVTDNTDYVVSQTIIYQAEKSCSLTASKVVSGSLPCGVVIEDTEVTTDTALFKAATTPRSATVRFYVDGEKFTEGGTANVIVTIHGE